MTFSRFVKNFLTLQVLIAVVVTICITVLVILKVAPDNTVPVSFKKQTTNTVREITLGETAAAAEPKMYTPIGDSLYTPPSTPVKLTAAPTVVIASKIIAMPINLPIKSINRGETLTDRTTVISTSMVYNMRMAHCDAQPSKCLEGNFSETP
jgi:hypothetical protein